VAVAETAMVATTAEAAVDQASETGIEAEAKTPVQAAVQAVSQKATEAKLEVKPTNLRITLAKALARVKPIAATSHQKAASKADARTDFRLTLLLRLQLVEKRCHDPLQCLRHLGAQAKHRR
jgi:uncharacterized protein (DUF1499 family)